MKYLLATLTGMAATLCVFVGGIAFAVAYLSAEPVPVQKLTSASSLTFTAIPKKVNPAEQDYQRVASRLPADTLPESQVAELTVESEVDEGEAAIDHMATSSIASQDTPETALSDNHVAWCSQRYRSYRKEDNSYTSYSGRSRECISPYSSATDSADDDPSYVEASITRSSSAAPYQDEAVANGLNSDHTASCFARYSSYRAEDNTYQPYGNGPRKQCE